MGEDAEVAPLELILTTLSGKEITVDGINEKTTLKECRDQIATVMQCPGFTIKLLVGTEQLVGDTCTLSELGLEGPRASAVILRTPGTDADYDDLFDTLAKAMRIGKRSEARELVDMGAGFDCNGDLLKRSGNTMLHLAVREGLVELTLHLIGLGVDVNATNDAGRPALAQAVIHGFPSLVITALLEAGANAEAVDLTGHTAFYYALTKNNDLLAAQLIASSSLEAEGTTASQCGSLVGYCKIREMPLTVKALLAAGAEDMEVPSARNWILRCLPGRRGFRVQ